MYANKGAFSAMVRGMLDSIYLFSIYKIALENSEIYTKYSFCFLID